MGDSSREIDGILSRFTCLTLLNDGKKVKCSLSGHEMPSNLDALKTYVTGKKFLRLQKRNKYDYTQHEPLLVASNDEKHKLQLYCNLTQRYVNKIPGHVERHVAGKRFKRELKRYEECQAKGIPFKPRRKSQKDKKDKAESGPSRLVTDMEQLGMDFIPSDSEEESEGSSAEMVSGDEAKDLENGDAGSELQRDKPKKSLQAIGNKKLGFKKVKPRIHSSKSRQRKFGASLHGTKGIKQPNKVSKVKKTRTGKK